jgi:tetratricopeptide (TPR) repeat protein
VRLLPKRLKKVKYPPMDFIALDTLRFAPDFTSAIDPQGQRIRFSKLERAMLKHFTSHPQQLITRNRLLDVVSPVDSGKLDRNVDYLVSRLRRKLGDSVKTPRFIATEYGEGYRWITKAGAPAVEPSTGPFLLIGPILGLEQTGELASELERLLRKLRDVLSDQFGHAGDVHIDFAASTHSNPACRYALEFSFLQTRGVLRCSSVLRDGRSGYIYHTWQHNLDPTLDAEAGAALQADYAREVHSNIVSAAMHKPAAAHKTAEMPLAVALDQAAGLFTNGDDKYQQVSDFLREKLAANPDDHHSAILLASSLHVGLTRDITQMEDPKQIDPILKEMESLLIAHLPGVQDEPLFLAATSKLLYFVGHHDLAEKLAETALDLGPSFAATLMVYAQIMVFQGDVECALEYYDYALERCEPDSQFYSMILVLKATALRAGGDTTEVPDLISKVVALDETVRMQLNLYLTNDLTEREPMVELAAPSLPVKAWQALQRHIFYISVRLFQNKQHRERTVNSLLSTAITHGGEACIIDELRTGLPELCQQLIETTGK